METDLWLGPCRQHFLLLSPHQSCILLFRPPRERETDRERVSAITRDLSAYFCSASSLSYSSLIRWVFRLLSPTYTPHRTSPGLTLWLLVTCVCSSSARLVFSSLLARVSLAVRAVAASISLRRASLCSIDSACTQSGRRFERGEGEEGEGSEPAVASVTPSSH